MYQVKRNFEVKGKFGKKLTLRNNSDSQLSIVCRSIVSERNISEVEFGTNGGIGADATGANVAGGVNGRATMEPTYRYEVTQTATLYPFQQDFSFQLPTSEAYLSVNTTQSSIYDGLYVEAGEIIAINYFSPPNVVELHKTPQGVLNLNSICTFTSTFKAISTASAEWWTVNLGNKIENGPYPGISDSPLKSTFQLRFSTRGNYRVIVYWRDTNSQQYYYNQKDVYVS